jgi:Xaa-Pro aminopeptidase
MTVVQRIEALRRLMAEYNLKAYYIPSTDPHQSEYVADTWLRRGYISGFDGSAGTVVVTTRKAGLWTDSRYFLQASLQLPGTGIELMKVGEPGTPTVEDWLAAELASGDQLGLDPSVVAAAQYDSMASALKAAGIAVQGVEKDLVELVWGAERPAMPQGEMAVHPVVFAGQSSADKLTKLREAMAGRKVDAMFLGALDEVAWLLNLRGRDVPFNPVFIAYVLVTRDQTLLFVDPGKVTKEVADFLPADVEVMDYHRVWEVITDQRFRGLSVWMDPNSTNQAVVDGFLTAEATPVKGPTPIAKWKASKNPAEIAGMVAAHVRDGVAMVRFLKWLEDHVGTGKETERSVQAKLTEVRSGYPEFVGMSFNTIVGYGGHGAIVHYSVTEESDVPVQPKGLLLVDSGAQYWDGTTDITRTVAVGPVTDEHRRAYTAVLKGHLNLDRTLFPEGTDGYQLDILARSPVWAECLNYGHGTGHGVGAYLSVHEGPFSVSLRKNLTPLAVGNILSNEPGFYKAGEFGIRIENLVQVVERQVNEYGRFLAFQALTLCPYDVRLIDTSRLHKAEIAQINRYHALVRDTLAPLLDEEHRVWLGKVTSTM